jgi:RNA polymerase sigma-70 factor, ECF subfamily
MCGSRRSGWLRRSTWTPARGRWSAGSSRPVVIRTRDSTGIRLELVRITIPRRYTSRHLAAVTRSVANVYERRERTRGLEMVFEPRRTPTQKAAVSRPGVNTRAVPGLSISVEVPRHGTDRVRPASEQSGADAVPRHDIESIYRSNAAQLARAVYAYVGGRRHLAEDAVAEAFARALEHVQEIRTPLPWIYTTALRVAARELQRERRPVPEMPDAVPGIDPLEIREVLEALATLTLNQRAAVVLHDQEGMTAPEIARLLGMSSATVRVHLFRGRKRLRELLGSEEVVDE